MIHAEVVKKNVLRWLEHEVFIMDAVVRVHATVSSVRKRHAEWIHIKHLDTSFTHRPGSIRIIQLYPLKDKKDLNVQILPF